MSADPPLFQRRSIVLVGMMGAGKSSVGRLLAERLALPFRDCDREVEREAGKCIADIFAAVGEAGFRAIEKQVTTRLIAGPTAVIASGGGAFIDPDMRAAILGRCTTLWLNAKPETLARRLSGGSARPLLSGQDPVTVLRGLAQARTPAYAEAQLHVETDGLSIAQAVETVLAALVSRAPSPSAAPSPSGPAADCRE